jgi:hypothetical protein
MARQLNCPCGVRISGTDDDELVENAQAHLAAEHPGHEYDREEILLLAY